MNKEIGVIGDFHNSKTQTAIADSIEHSNKKLGYKTGYRWIETTILDNNNYDRILKNLNGIWSASGSPFKSMNGSLNAIKFARENSIPHIGTCGGYQHSIIEYARNVLGFINAGHAEYNTGTTDLFVNKMTCSLAGTRGIVCVQKNTLAYKIFGTNEIEVDYYCSYGLNDDYKDLVLQGEILASGFDVNNSVRMIELTNHPFFIITAFVPQIDSTFDKPNPLVTEFVKQVNNI